MRQAGIIAAAGVYALEHHVARLAEDHAHAHMLAQALAALPKVRLDPADVETNIVIFEVGATGMPAEQIGAQLEKSGVRVSVMGRTNCAQSHIWTLLVRISTAPSTYFDACSERKVFPGHPWGSMICHSHGTCEALPFRHWCWRHAVAVEKSSLMSVQGRRELEFPPSDLPLEALL